MQKKYFVGQSEYTPDKQAMLKEVTRTWILVAKGASNKNRQAFTPNSFNIIDLTAGNGFTRVKGIRQDGSALVIAKNAKQWSTNGKWDVHFKLSFVDIDKTNCQLLNERIHKVLVPPVQMNLFENNEPRLPHNWQVFNEDNEIFLENLEIDPKTLTLFYIDPNGASLPFEALRKALAPSNNHDFLIHYNSLALKRVRRHKSVNKEGHYLNLEEYLKSFYSIRRNIYVSEPNDRWHWVFIFGTNTGIFEKAFEEMGFLDIASSKGRQRLLKLSYTQSELKENQFI